MLTTMIVLTCWIARDLCRLIDKDFAAADFGICPGLAQPQGKQPVAPPALTDWMHLKIQDIAGLGNEHPPLTIGDLDKHGIEIAAMTTDLSSRRPFQLPLNSSIHWFSKAEWSKLFPASVMAYLTGGHPPYDHGQAGVPDDLYRLVVGKEFPVLLVARMSLSFPGLFSAVPLYRHDDQVRIRNSHGKIAGCLSRCLFSDGGISSNFPIHFFDQFIPGRPTFGIALEDWDETRHKDQRIHLPKGHTSSVSLPVRPIKGLSGFLSSILNTAKDWQDTLQARLPGNAERVVAIRLECFPIRLHIRNF